MVGLSPEDRNRVAEHGTTRAQPGGAIRRNATTDAATAQANRQSGGRVQEHSLRGAAANDGHAGGVALAHCLREPPNTGENDCGRIRRRARRRCGAAFACDKDRATKKKGGT
jgi:hypothetical protein